MTGNATKRLTAVYGPGGIERRRAGRRRTDPKPDSHLDRALAFISYVTLVITALCVFSPVNTASAISYAQSLVVESTVSRQSLPEQQEWALRGTGEWTLAGSAE